jgi:hypothetical protein
MGVAVAVGAMGADHASEGLVKHNWELPRRIKRML